MCQLFASCERKNVSSKAPPLPFCSRLADSHICAVLDPHRFTFVQRLMSLLCGGRCNGILTFVTKTALILCQGEGRWGLCTAEVDGDDDIVNYAQFPRLSCPKKVHQIMMMNMTTAVKGSFCSVVRCQPLLCRRLTPSRPHLHWLASTLNY